MPTGFSLSFGAYADPSFVGMKGVITRSAALVDGSGNVSQTTWTVTIAGDGTASVSGLPYNDDGSTYRCQWQALSYKPSPGNRVFQVLSTQGTTIDYDLIANIDGTVTPSVSPQVPLVTSVNGMTGAVVITGGGGSVSDATAASKGVVQLAGDLAGTAAAPTVPGLAGKLSAASNLSDVANASTARTNLGLGTAAAQPTSAFDTSGAAATAQTFAVQRANHTGTQAATTITGLATVATTGAYADLSGKPTIPAAPADATSSSKGLIQLAGDLAGTAAAPDITGLTVESRRGTIAPVTVGSVLSPGAGGTWDAGLVESPVVRWDINTQRLAMTYVGYDSPNVHAQVGLAWSDDGGLTWTKDAGNPIFTYTGGAGDPDQNGTTGPVWIYDKTNATYYLFYIGLTATGYEQGTKTLCYATATSLNGPWTRHGAIISPTGTGWRATSIYHADPIDHGGVKYLFFNAKGGDGKEYIGYATSSSGTWAGPWTVDDVNSPLLSPGTAAAWDDTKVGDPSVYRVGETWYMAYYGYTSDVTQDGVAWTTNTRFPLGPSGGQWTKLTTNPLLVPGGSVADTKYAGKPFIRRTARRLSHYYTALSTGGVRSIALAIDPDDRVTLAEAVAEYTTAITTTSTAFVSITPSTWLQNFTGRLKPQVRFHARVNASSTTVTLRDHNYTGATATATGNVGFQVVTSTWAAIPDGSGALSSYCEWKASAAVTITITNLVWEFRWVNP